MGLRALAQRVSGTYRGQITSVVDGRPPSSVTGAMSCNVSPDRDSLGRPLLRCQGLGHVVLFAVDGEELDANVEVSWGQDRSSCTGSVEHDGARLVSEQTCLFRGARTLRRLDMSRP
jgi:hypothetical protein